MSTESDDAGGPEGGHTLRFGPRRGRHQELGGPVEHEWARTRPPPRPPPSHAFRVCSRISSAPPLHPIPVLLPPSFQAKSSTVHEYPAHVPMYPAYPAWPYMYHAGAPPAGYDFYGFWVPHGAGYHPAQPLRPQPAPSPAAQQSGVETS